MILKDVSEVLQSSALAPLFLNLEKVTVEEQEEPAASRLRLELRSVLPASGDSGRTLSIIESEDDWLLRIPQIASSKEFAGVARVGHVNLMVRIGRLYWDPEDGEIGIDWVIRKEVDHPISPLHLEYVVACLISMYAMETLYFMQSALKNAGLNEGVIRPLVESAKREIKEHLAPALESILQG